MHVIGEVHETADGTVVLWRGGAPAPGTLLYSGDAPKLPTADVEPMARIDHSNPPYYFVWLENPCSLPDGAGLYLREAQDD